MSELNRRQMLAASGLAVAGTFLRAGRATASQPQAKVEELKVISWKPPLYHGWPTLARRKNGQLLLAFSGGREAHVCPFGRVELMTSDDGGESWNWPRVLLDSAIDDRDAGVLETDKGTILVTTFTSLAYADQLNNALKKQPGQPGAWDETKRKEWLAVHNRISEEQRQKDLGTWMLRSTDGGLTWSARYAVPVNSPHGPVQLSGGRLLYAGKKLWEKEKRIGVCQSTDDGQTWDWLAEIPTRSGDDFQQYHELHAVETNDGKLIVHIRNHNKANHYETLQSESTDGGRTWSEPHSIGVWGYPSHLLRLRDGRLLMTYGYRRAPIGNQARLSSDGGQTWSEPLILSDDGASGDLGYPSTVELDDGTLVSVWYEKLKDSPNAVLRQARWRLVG